MKSAIEILRTELILNSKYKETLSGKVSQTIGISKFDELIKQAEEMEKQQKLKHQLFIGKVICEIGFDKTNELLKEVNETFDK